MKSLTGKFSSAPGWAVTLILLFGAGLFVAACGDEEVPSPTTPAPPPPAPTPPAPEPEPEPEPAPEPPAVPVGLRISASGVDSITWTWNAVEGATGYVVQSNMDEMWDDTDTVMFGLLPFTTETTYTRTGLEAGTTVYARVAAAAGTAEAPLVSAFSTHVTGMTAEPEPEAPPAPANLRLKERGSDFIEWEWDEAPGADGYESEFSTDGISFVALQPHAGASNTSRRVANLAAETAGHLQVRSYTGSGTGADTVRGDWSASDRQTTDEPPPAVALDAPDGLEASDETEESITLEWDSVRNADSYEVEQREPGDDWEDASCGGGDNAVEDEECVASGLDEGTDYDFRVRAIPADDDDAHTTSDWSDIAETSTGGTPPPEPTDPGATGGGGALEITWSSEPSNLLVFTWNRMGDARYKTVELAAADMSSSDPCEGKDFAGASASVNTFFNDDNATAGQVAGVCVQVEDDESTTSYAFGVARPVRHAPDTAGEGDDIDSEQNRYVTNRLNWTGIQVVEDFDFELRLVADPGRMNEIQDTTDDDDIQAACSDGSFLVQRTATRTIAISHAVTSGLVPYTGYLLCARHLNGTGSTNWIVPENEAEHHTLPAAPPGPSPDSSRTGTRDGGEMFDVAWTVDLQNSATVPWPKEGFMVSRTMRLSSSSTPKAAACDQAYQDTDVIETLDGIDFEAEYRRPMAHLANHYAFACIRAEAEDAATRLGPWTIGGTVTISKKVANLTAEQAEGVTAVTLTIEGHTDDSAAQATWYYKANTGPHTTCSSAVGGSNTSLAVGDTPAMDLTAGSSYTYTAYGDMECKQSIDSVGFRAQ